MDKRLIIFLTMILLAACVPTTEQDLYTQAQSSKAAANAAERLAQYQGNFLTATADAPLVHITETAAALSFTGTQRAMDGTATADAPLVHITETAAALSFTGTQRAMDGTATAVLWTPTPIPTATPDLTATLAVAQLHAQETVIANNTKRDDLAMERQQVMNAFWAALPGIVFVVLVAVIVLAVIVVIRSKRYRPVPVDQRGNPQPIIDVVEGTVTDTDRNPNYRGNTREDILKEIIAEILRRRFLLPPSQPQITAERQDATTERDQMIDLGTRGLPGPTGGQNNANKRLAGQGMNKQLSDSNLEGRFKVLDDSSNLEVIDAEIIKVLDADWKEQK